MEVTFSIDDHLMLPEDEWSALVKMRAGFECERCDDDDLTRGVEAHHMDRDHGNNILANGECLCSRCHRREHMCNRDKEKASVSAKKTWKTRRILDADITLAEQRKKVRVEAAKRSWVTRRENQQHKELSL